MYSVEKLNCLFLCMFFSSCKETPVAEQAEDDLTASWLWNVSEKWTRLQQA